MNGWVVTEQISDRRVVGRVVGLLLNRFQTDVWLEGVVGLLLNRFQTDVWLEGWLGCY